MPDYRESIVSGLRWRRANAVQIQNDRGQVPTIRFIEEDVVSLDSGDVMAVHAGAVEESLVDPNESFDLRHPETGEVLGSCTYQEIYVILSSLYIHVATKRDQQV